MKHFSLFFALAGFVFLGIGVESAAAQGNGAVSTKTDITTSLYNECCDEFIELSGTLHQVMNTKTGKSHLNFQGLTATGSNGNTYNGNYVANSSFELNDDGSYSGTNHVIVHLTSESGCSFTAHIIISYSWNAVDGYVEEQKKYEIECEGALS